MNKKQIWVTIAVLVILILAGWLAFASMQEEDAMMEKNGDSMMEGDKMEGDKMEGDKMEGDGGSMTNDNNSAMRNTEGTYESYSDSKLALAESGDVVLFFHADWCPLCRATEASIEANASSIPANTHILKVNYDDATALRQKYGVTTQHTFVQVDAQGNALAKWSGSPDLADILNRAV